jgi:hypothetical protein
LDVAERTLAPIRAGGTRLDSAGSASASTWLAEQGLPAPATRWHVAIGLDVRDIPAPVVFDESVDSRFHIEIYTEEWGYFFCHRARSSWIRITDAPFVHMRDDFRLLASTPDLKHIGSQLRSVEHQFGLHFRRDLAFVNTNLANAEPAIRQWINAL